MLDSGYRCPRCNSILESRAVFTNYGRNCACQTNDCTCNYDTEMVCPECSFYGNGEIVIVDSMAAVCSKEEEEKLKKELKELIENASWMGDKKARQREHNKNKQKQQFSKKFTKLNPQRRSRRRGR